MVAYACNSGNKGDFEFEASLGYNVGPSHQNTKQGGIVAAGIVRGILGWGRQVPEIYNSALRPKGPCSVVT